ncbi:MAG: AAA family ATPase, partial [Clostridia bacterium]|nr:AAA family ATPase [Clostridia bacterium]
MYIRKIYIKEFGALSERELVFSDGINLLEGSNESGKSTILAFIRFMLYGMPRRAAGESVSERERGLSWANGIAEGNMELLSGGKLYRIERKGQLRGGTRETYTESCKIFDAETGEEIFKGEVPGKLFLGITGEVFTATACIRQLECTDMNSDEINSSIENLLFAADEEIDTQRVQAKLDDLRRTLLYKNGRGGRLFELEATRSLLENRLESAKQTAETVIAKEAAVEKLKAFSERSKKQIEETEAQLRLYETATTLKRFETLHSYEAQYDALENELERLSVE